MDTIVLLTFGSIAWISGALLVYWFIDVVVDMFLSFILSFKG